MVDARLPRCPHCHVQTERVELDAGDVRAWCRWCGKLIRLDVDTATQEVTVAKQKPKKPAQEKPAQKPKPAEKQQQRKPGGKKPSGK